ncbi:MAG: hypothetical protein ACRC7C_11590 [Beijerinckiaceae bacterium]
MNSSANNPMTPQTAMVGAAAPFLKVPPIPKPMTLARLFAGGALGLFIWEIWARVFTKALLGYPLQPAGLIDALFQHNFGLEVPWLLREALHYLVGIVGYPVAYYIISRAVRGYGLVLDIIVWVTFTLGVAAAFLAGRGMSFHLPFLLIVTLFIATRFINKRHDIADAISWGTFTWLNALGIFAPLGGLSFYLLGEGGELSFMSFAGHVIYGAVAAFVFERLERRASEAVL